MNWRRLWVKRPSKAQQAAHDRDLEEATRVFMTEAEALAWARLVGRVDGIEERVADMERELEMQVNTPRRFH